ncbi:MULTISPECIES: HAD family hydrolase [Mycobacteriaceae]|uniref:HAD family hydrolase n=1 Tax=Mycolicibacterium neoaurum VKM Ac-1815D TaxID=700508 RepID=V5XDA2_MYCNE|nr:MULTISPECIES: HAD family phosphatase [Mycobacteriaceae]AHC25651.1 HAD family hydrolase [Mycolicibacterium neoaurum VKM Ac-1815D]AMO06091.1 HAD family hydrolase [Mycolicibacterium neoaurum]AXK75567.1 HAD family phosphatase [Mycolicibacterium neoaurum]KJQ50397.1 HAD family hydrolase [Mycolicibacterium neoaurum]KUM09572.1 HAD family hydrolase [Mycolicibacterium neoaurum]
MRAVLWDMDGTLVDSEKLWDIAIQDLYRKHGRELTAEVRTSTIGGSSENVLAIVYADLGLPPDPEDMARTADWMHDYVGELFAEGLPWCAGAREMLDALTVADVTMALVTNTRRVLTEKALDSIGRDYFAVTVCGDEVPSGKPAPDPYLRAATLLGLEPGACLAVEDSVTGAAAAEAAGCAVLVVPNEVAVPGGPRRRHAASLADLDVHALRDIHTELGVVSDERSA